jgi:uncharacterized protein with HEPN domain
MNRDYKLFLQDILDACHHVDAFVKNMRFDEFLRDEKTSSAVIRKLEIIGEAAKNIPLGIRNAYPDINWKDFAGMRDRLIHGYFGVDYSLVWNTATITIPELITAISHIFLDLERERDSST